MENNFYITTPIYYPSGQPHMGHAYSSIVSDVFARFKTIDGYKVHFLTGTDEHGQKIERAAKEKQMDPLSFCNEISKTFKDLCNLLNLSNLILFELITFFPTFSKLTVIFSLIIDCTCPIPHSLLSGFITLSPGPKSNIMAFTYLKFMNKYHKL